MKKINAVEEYIESHEKWSEALTLLRSIINSTDLEETLKWNIPTYTINGKNVCGIGAFKAHFGIWFFNGVFLEDKHNILRNAQEGKTKAMRQLNFSSIDEIDKNIVLQYINEAIENQKLGKEIKPKRIKKKTEIPDDLNSLFDINSELKKSFYTLTPSKQRAYCEYIQSAKKATTKQHRFEKITSMIMQGMDLYDKYKKTIKN